MFANKLLNLRNADLRRIGRCESQSLDLCIIKPETSKEVLLREKIS
ncbi:hypothetical protein RMSM_06346 [Rhodopirellula maiorica SM1]|uniref:Uncharacterized protein n=1 Tax=Rhodopirellula maiorica SM1 TaxID=1265738 RepID=M5RRZ5_9BACT|nr:hypothetical protein RMSM_06346 [Rhodopirellula maiorica SM1]